MRILFITPYIPNVFRPRPYNFLKVLVLRHQITLVCPVFDDGEDQAIQQLQNDLPALEVIAVPMDKQKAISNSLLALPQGLPMQSRYCYSRVLVDKVLDLITSQHFDLAHVEHFRVAYMIEILANYEIPIVYDSVDCISLLIERTLHNGPIKNRLISLVELEASRRYESKLMKAQSDHFKSVCVTSLEDANELESLSGQRAGTVRVVPNGVDINFFSYSAESKREPATVIFSGKMSYHSNIAAARLLVNEVWPLVRKAYPEAKLWIVGNGPPRDLRNSSGRDGVEVTGFVPDIRPYLQKATVAVAPMVYSVGIQNKILEAMACGIPVITNPEAARSIIGPISKQTLVVQASPRPPQEFANSILELFKSPATATTIGKQGYNFVVQNCSWKKAAHQLEHLWIETCSDFKVKSESYPQITSVLNN